MLTNGRESYDAACGCDAPARQSARGSLRVTDEAPLNMLHVFRDDAVARRTLTSAPTSGGRARSSWRLYPRSFKTLAAAASVTLRGSAHRLPEALGVDVAVRSLADPEGGYGDIANYTDLDPMFGTLLDSTASWRSGEDALVMDLVVNHSSGSPNTPWFRGS